MKPPSPPREVKPQEVIAAKAPEAIQEITTPPPKSHLKNSSDSRPKPPPKQLSISKFPPDFTKPPPERLKQASFSQLPTKQASIPKLPVEPSTPKPPLKNSSDDLPSKQSTPEPNETSESRRTDFAATKALWEKMGQVALGAPPQSSGKPIARTGVAAPTTTQSPKYDYY